MMSYNPQNEQIIVRSDGNITVFGLNNHFKTDMPSKLISITAPDEYKYTIHKVNKVLKKNLSINIKILLCSCICFCCTLGFSIWPSVMINRKTKRQVRNILKEENERIYHHLGLHWSLGKKSFGPLPTVEYVLQIDFLSKPQLYLPDG
nr:cysteine-rich hydrophobic domain-containing protein 2 [Leptinotarsa decemlineata]XP_023019950.1 cysteine-rich hydrophobic domain-containing protein 2 [Leptinotarsa decemlineata]